MVRGKNVNEALGILKFMPKKGADIIYKVVHSAAYNAKNNFKQSLDDLIITQILVTKGPTYKRSQPISRGRAHPIRKRTCHITVEVGMPGDEKTKEEVKPKKVVKKESPKKETAKKAPAKKTTTKKAEKKEDKK